MRKKTQQEKSQRVRRSKGKHRGGQEGAVPVNKLFGKGCTEVTAESLAKD